MSKKATEAEIEQKATLFRQENGYGLTEPVHLKSLLLKKNVLSVFRPLGESLSGMAILINGNRFMLVNSHQRLGKQHFTIAHELYHLFVQENFTSQRCKTGEFNRTDMEEYKADLFAAYFLLPAEGVKKLIPPDELKSKAEVSIQTILKIEQYFMVSHQATLYRLKSMGYIDSVLYNKYSEGIISLARAYGYPTTLYSLAPEQQPIGDYGVLAKESWTSGAISESHYYELMGAIGVELPGTDYGTDNGF
ncbi:MAG TPA: ImmA/IrrE family metallo-endopeptidase [Cyclobacteriaceae bacterium]|jgi:Zn-dependent peptidase ImmA (M78 family)|nr:ImmA/IrrE family metallo-endopeptidase [Cyclobacteriaceae bacterium]